MLEKTVRILTPIAWVLIVFVVMCHSMKYMFVYHQDILRAIYPLFLVFWVAFLFSGRAVLARCIRWLFG